MIGTGSFATDGIFELPGFTLYYVAIFFILGAVFGSFINCMAWRVAHGESVSKGRSHCAVCGHTLSPLDLIPIVSYLLLKGRCRYCHEKISPRYMLTELFMGLGFVICLLRFGISIDTLRALIVLCILLAISLVDLDVYLIPDRFVVALIMTWILTLPFVHADGVLVMAGGGALLRTMAIRGLIGGLAIGGGILVLSLIMDKVLGKESLGGGDVKLLFAAGLYLGAAGGLLCLIVSSIVGLIFVAARRSKQIPFGPSIALAWMICLLWGEPVIKWYMSLLM